MCLLYPVFQWAGVSNAGTTRFITELLKQFLSGPAVNERTDDDKRWHWRCGYHETHFIYCYW